jgi:hypothetical protein
MAMNVKYIKLLNGEELSAEVVTEDLKTTIKNPIRLVLMPSKADPKNPQVGLAPWAEFSDDKEIVLDRSHILCIMTPIQEIVNQYNAIFGGILAPSSKLILPQ